MLSVLREQQHGGRIITGLPRSHLLTLIPGPSEMPSWNYFWGLSLLASLENLGSRLVNLKSASL